MSVIFLFSSLPGSGIDYAPPLWYVLERKSAHVLEYAVLMLLSIRFFLALFLREMFWRIMLLAGAFSLAYAASDELHQFFVFGRGAKLTDVAIDGGGIALMASIVFLLQEWHRKKPLHE